MKPSNRHNAIAIFTAAAIAAHLLLRFLVHASYIASYAPLTLALIIGGAPLIWEILVKLYHREITSDILAALSILTAILLREYLAGAIIVLMLSGGASLEAYAVSKASSVLQALARRMPSIAHRKRNREIAVVPAAEVNVGDILLVYPHEICPVDGVVLEGHGSMDESYLTGEPFKISKTPGSNVISGAINGGTILTIQASKQAVDSRYAKIMEVMRASEQQRPRLRRLGDRLGAVYAPLALGLAVCGWIASGDPTRFLAILVVATPCPLLIGIPVAIIGSVTLAARRSIIIKNPAILEQIGACRVVIFDKTGTLTCGKASLTGSVAAPGFDADEVLALTASIEQYSKHPLSEAILAEAEAKNIHLFPAAEISEKPGFGLHGVVKGKHILITSREKLPSDISGMENLPAAEGGLECHVIVDGAYAAAFRFSDEIRPESQPFVGHLGPKHRFERQIILSGDRPSEVNHTAQKVGIGETYAGKSPEEKLEFVRTETAKAKTLFIGDGVNDAPALMAATVGVAIGRNSDITAEAADAVIMDSSLQKVDELMHLSRKMRNVALQSAVGGMGLSIIGMLYAFGGHLPPISGAILQEIIDLLAILNALRAAFPPKYLTDF
jgi:heavy metal translocating P-type ATPase